MITREDFMLLGAGDVIVWHRNHNSPYFRTISEGPRDSGHDGVYLPIRQRSWTKRAHTCYFWNDLKNIITKTGKRVDMLLTEEELERILRMGIKPKADLDFNISESIRLMKLGMRKCSKNAFKLAKRTMEAFNFAEIQ